MSFHDQNSFNNANPGYAGNGIPQQKPQNQLWMGELDPSWDESFVKSLWISSGFPQVNVRLIKDPKQQQANAGYCFVEFPSVELASQALTQNGVKIPNSNRFIRLNWANGQQLQGQQQQFNQDQSRTNEVSIFIGDLAPDVSESALFEFFATKYTSVSGTKIMIDRMTGQSKSYGFVRFLDENEQQRSLVEMQGSILNGRPIRVSTAAPRSRPQQPSQQQQQPFQQRQPFQQHQQQGFAPVQGQQPIQQGSNGLDPQGQPPLNQFTDPNNTTVFVGGLSSLVTEDELRLYFQPFGDITYVKIPAGKGCGFVQYLTRPSAELAILKMQGYPISNSRVRLSWGRSNSNPSNLPYRQQPEFPPVYGYPPKVPSNLKGDQLVNFNPYSIVNANQGSFGVDQINQQNQFNSEQSDNIDQSRLNQLYLAARDGRLDAIDSASNGYIFE
jgi:RNA recognition motif-containing protein